MSPTDAPVVTWQIRPSGPEEIARLPEIERAAAAQFDAGRVPDPSQTRSLAELERQRQEGLVWVIVGAEIGGFLLATRQGDDLFIEEVDVHPRFARQGLGAALIRHAREQAEHLGLGRVTLTTFADVPWNGPYYRRLGFVPLARPHLPGYLRDILDRDCAAGLSERIAMAWPTGTAR